MTQAPRRRITWVAGIGALCLSVFVWHVAHHWFSTVDTTQLLVGVGAADRCLHGHVFSNCNGAGFGDVSHFALLQYLPAFAMKRLGADIQTAYQGLCWLSALAFVGLLALLRHVGMRTGGWRNGALLLLAGVASPLLWYSHAGFGEALEAFVLAAFAAGLVLRWHPAVTGTALFFAVLAKEPNVVILLALALVVIVARPSETRWSRGELLAVATAAAAGVAVSAGFNEFRYGTLRNTYYVDDAVRPPPADSASSFAAMFVAPNVGLLWFWPASAAVAALAVRGASDRTRRMLWLIVAVFAAVVASFAAFWGPFGWEAWGPRHLLPWVPAFLIALVGVRGETLSLPRAGVALPAIAAIAVLAVPQVSVLRDWKQGFALFDPGPACRIHLPDVHEYRAAFGSTDGYYACLRRQAWTAPPTLADTAGHLDRAGLAWALLLMTSAAALGRRALASGP